MHINKKITSNFFFSLETKEPNQKIKTIQKPLIINKSDVTLKFSFGYVYIKFRFGKFLFSNETLYIYEVNILQRNFEKQKKKTNLETIVFVIFNLFFWQTFWRYLKKLQLYFAPSLFKHLKNIFFFLSSFFLKV